MKKIIWSGISIIVLGLCAFLFNYLTLQLPIKNKIKTDPRNDGVNICIHYKYYLIPSQIVFDIRSISGSNAPVDVFRVFLQSAEALQNKKINKVELASKGKTKFYITGAYFKTLGDDYGSQNAIYTTRTFPENLYLSDGAKAYEEWSGGIFGVLNKQMEDFNNACKKWFLEDFNN